MHWLVRGRAEVLNKINTSDTSTIDKLDKDRDNTPNRLTSDEKIFSNQVATLANEVVKFIEVPDGTKLKIFFNSSQAWYTGDIKPSNGPQNSSDNSKKEAWFDEDMFFNETNSTNVNTITSDNDVYFGGVGKRKE
ncbi:851_t:CDS:2 [Funneliformis caledonium]|uniref:851_t:CDS:1 n=1 Tax=Funneliformis caledonium TaxID=1117310 RepID=A0A9N8Z3Y1_9GLOM|nr:851_t:CDS:2 [Funneliformis caledonium]